jgi:hypothetical protein
MSELKPLTIEQAVGEDVKLKDIPTEGGGVLIPRYEDYREGDTVVVFIEDAVVVTRQPLVDLGDDYFEVLIPRDEFLRHLGLRRKIKYTVYLRNLNPLTSDTAFYNIDH